MKKKNSQTNFGTANFALLKTNSSLLAASCGHLTANRNPQVENWEPRGGFLKIISVGIPTYAGMKTGFYADFSPRNRFSRRHRSECRRKKSLQAAPSSAYISFSNFEAKPSPSSCRWTSLTACVSSWSSRSESPGWPATSAYGKASSGLER